MANESDVVLNFKMDGQIEYATTIKEINQVMNTAAIEYKNHISAMGNDATATEKLRANKQKLEIQLEGAEKRTRMLREEYEKSVAETGEYSKESEKLYKQMIQSETGANTLRNSLERVNEEIEEAGDLSVEAAKKIAKIEEAGEKVKGVGEKMSVGVTAPILAIGTAALKVSDDVRQMSNKIQAGLGLTREETDKLTESAKNIYKNGYGDSLDGVGEALIQTKSIMRDLNGEELEMATTRAIQLAETYDADVNEVLRGGNALMDQMGYSSEEAFGLMASGAQNGLNFSGELFDNLSEYTPLFNQAGFSGKEMFATINAGVKDNAYNLDYVNDLVKEFGINLNDGTVKEGIQSMSQETKNLYTEFEKGNVSGSQLFSGITQELSGMDDQTVATQLGVGMMGTKFEDLGNQTVYSMGQATDSMVDAKNGITSLDEASKNTIGMEKAFRNVSMSLVELGDILSPYIQNVAEYITMLAEWFGGLDSESKKMIVTIASIVAVIGPLLVILGTLMGSITKIMTAVQMLGPIIAAVTSPIGLVVIAIVALIAIFAILWIKCEAFRNFWIDMWQTIQTVFDGVITAIGGVLSSWVDGVIAQFKNVFDTIVGVLTGIIDFVVGVFTGDWKRAWEGIVQIFSSIVDGIVNAFKIPINTIIGMLNAFIRGINKVKIPNWVPKIGGKGFDIPQIPMLATGGHVLNGQAIVGEAGPELLSNSGGRTTVTPLNENEKRKGLSGALNGGKIEQIINIQNVNTSSVNEMNSMNRQIKRASEIAISGMRG